jgi:hypothetical protein
MCEDLMNTLYLIRHKDTGLYWRGAKVRYGKDQRTAWTDAPAKAWHCWQVDQVDRLFGGHFSPLTVPPYKVVAFTMIEVP